MKLAQDDSRSPDEALLLRARTRVHAHVHMHTHTRAHARTHTEVTRQRKKAWGTETGFLLMDILRIPLSFPKEDTLIFWKTSARREKAATK